MIDPRAEAVRILKIAESLAETGQEHLDIVDRYIALGYNLIGEEEEGAKDPQPPTEDNEDPEIKIDVHPNFGFTEKQIGDAAARTLQWMFTQRRQG